MAGGRRADEVKKAAVAKALETITGSCEIVTVQPDGLDPWNAAMFAGVALILLAAGKAAGACLQSAARGRVLGLV